MRWVRDRRRIGAWAALFAFAVQIVLSFGHVHVGKIAAASSATTVAWQEADRDAPATPGHPPGAQDFCAVCATISLVAGSVLPTASSILPPAATEHRWLAQLVSRLISFEPFILFQARAPPVVL